MSNYVISQIKRDHLMNLLADGRREDGRQLDEMRKITVDRAQSAVLIVVWEPFVAFTT